MWIFLLTHQVHNDLLVVDELLFGCSMKSLPVSLSWTFSLWVVGYCGCWCFYVYSLVTSISGRPTWLLACIFDFGCLTVLEPLPSIAWPFFVLFHFQPLWHHVCRILASVAFLTSLPSRLPSSCWNDDIKWKRLARWWYLEPLRSLLRLQRQRRSRCVCSRACCWSRLMP